MYQIPGQTFHVHGSNADIDAMLFDVSNRMARAQLARQISNSSSTFRQRASRILKANSVGNSVGNSPQNVQRRRTTTASHKSFQYRPDTYHHGGQFPQEGYSGSANGHQSWPVPEARPVSWHPSSVGHNRIAARQSNYEATWRTNPGYHTVAVNGLPTPMTQPDMNAEMPVDLQFSLDGTSMPYQPMNMSTNAYDAPGLSLDSSYQNYLPNGSSNRFQYNGLPMSNALSHIQTDYPTQSWAESLPMYPVCTAPPTPDMLPIQNPAGAWNSKDAKSTPSLPKKDSKELVGMGLYDGPDRKSMSMDSQWGFLGADPHHESPGKGLKLEETWEPPEEEENSGDEDEIEEESETDEVEQSPIFGMVSEKIQSAFNPPFRDMSNQSFFFDNDDTCYDNTMFDRPMAEMIPNGANNTMQGNFMWV